MGTRRGGGAPVGRAGAREAAYYYYRTSTPAAVKHGIYLCVTAAVYAERICTGRAATAHVTTCSARLW